MRTLILLAALAAATPLQAQRRAPEIPKEFMRAALVGGVIGTIPGAIIGAVTTEECRPSDWVCFGPEVGAIMGAGVGFLVGATVGVIIEALDGPDRDRVQLRVAPERASLRLSLPLPHPGTAR